MYQMGLTDDAGTDLGTYAWEHPNDAEAQNALGVVMLRAGNYASAKAHLDRAIALRPEQGEYYYNRANVLKEQKEFKAAIDDYTRAVAFIPDLAGAYINRGDVRFLLRETEGACQDLKKACELMLQHKSPETVCGTVQNINREGETARVMTLAELKETQVDMFTTVFIGNSQTRNIDGKMVTPRGYKNV